MRGLAELFCLLLCLMSIGIVTSKDIECLIEEFSQQSLGIFANICSNSRAFQANKYSDYQLVDKPNRSNGYSLQQMFYRQYSCIETASEMSVEAMTSITVSYVTFKLMEGPNPSLRLMVYDTNTMTHAKILGAIDMYVDGINTWQTRTVKINKAAKIKIRVEFDSRKTYAAFAIDYIMVKGPRAKNCEPGRDQTTTDYPEYPTTTDYTEYNTTTDYPEYNTTTEYPEYITTTEYPEYITTTEYPEYITTTEYPEYITTTDYPEYNTTIQQCTTEFPTFPTSSPKPPPPTPCPPLPSCNCNCNCNCGKYIQV